MYRFLWVFIFLFFTLKPLSCSNMKENEIFEANQLKKAQISSFSLLTLIRWNEIRANRCYNLQTLTAAMILMHNSGINSTNYWPSDSFDLDMTMLPKVGAYDIKITGTGGDQSRYDFQTTMSLYELQDIMYKFESLRKDYQTIILQCLEIQPDKPKEIYWITKETVDAAPIQNSTFENDVSRYEVWKDISRRACSSSITRCTILERLKSCIIVQNYDEQKKQINIHAVYDLEFKCGTVIRQEPNKCRMKYSKFGVFRDLAESLLLPIEFSNIACSQKIATQRYFYDGACTITVNKGEHISVKITAGEQNNAKMCYSVFINNDVIREGTVESNGILNIIYQPRQDTIKLKIYCGSTVYERELHMNAYMKCLYFFKNIGLSNEASRHTCRFINAYKVALLCIFIAMLFFLIIRCGCMFLFLPGYIIITIILVLCQICLKRRNKVCQRCASVLYWGDPHLTCRMACAYCGQFASSDFKDLYAHKKDCENIHLKISPVIIFRTILRSKFLIHCMNFIIASIMIWLLSNMFTVEGRRITGLNATDNNDELQTSSSISVKELIYYIGLTIIIKLVIATITICACIKTRKRRKKKKMQKLKDLNDEITSEELVMLKNYDTNVYQATTVSTNINRSAYMLLIFYLIISHSSSNSVDMKSINLPSLQKAANIRGGDIFNLPNVKTLTVPNFIGGNHDSASGMLSAVNRLSKALDGEYDEYDDSYDDQVDDLNAQVDYVLSKLKNAANRLENRVNDGKKNMQFAQRIAANIQQSKQNIINAVNDYQQRMSTVVESHIGKIDELDRKLKELHDQITAQNQTADQTLVDLYRNLQQRKALINNSQRSRRPVQRNRQRRHIETEQADGAEEKVLITSLSSNDAIKHHSHYVKSRHNKDEKTIDHLDPMHSARLMPMNSKCKSQGLYTHTIEKDINNQMGNIKVVAEIDIIPEMCTVFMISTDDVSVETTQLVVKVTQTWVEWPATYLYSSYKTDDISIVSQEWCTSGSQYCRQQIIKDEQHFLKSGGIVISWDYCQNWGCDFPGCGTAVSGSCCIICRDTYLPDTEIRVYKLGKPKFTFELCYQYPGDSQCLITSSTLGRPTKSFSFSSSFNDLDSSFKENDNIAIDHHGRIMSGRICDPSSYCDDFGSMQVVNGITHGKDGHSADFVCHGIGWKTYEVRSCFKNTWNLHSMLRKMPADTYKMHETVNGAMISEKNIYLGKATWSFEMKGVHLTEKKSNVECEVTLSSCTGCWSCIEHAVCELTIDSNLDFAGSIHCENALAAKNHLGIKAGQHSYHIIISFNSKMPKPICYIYAGDKSFKIKLAGIIELQDNNITWTDDDFIPWHKNPTEANSMFWSWHLFNPFNPVGWYSWRAIVKGLLLGLIIIASLACIAAVIKYFKFASQLLQDICTDLRSNSIYGDGKVTQLSLADLYINNEINKKRRRKYDQLEDNKRKGIHKFD